MRIFISAIAVALLLSSAGASSAADSAREQRNKQVAIALYEAAINEKDFAKASQYLDDHYIQHSPTAPDGKDGLKAAIAFLRQNFPDMHAEIKHVYTDGDFVILHVFTVFKPGDRGSAIVDVIRLTKDGKAAEHWDVTQPIPEQLANGNGVF